jgi:hypothetical protein
VRPSLIHFSTSLKSLPTFFNTVKRLTDILSWFRIGSIPYCGGHSSMPVTVVGLPDTAVTAMTSLSR